MKNTKNHRKEIILLVCISLIYAAWAVGFIYRNSYVAIDGRRYFSLFDDSMISMRYAWNFAHGHGLVWNVGERVEGYTNLLMTLVMTLASLFLNKTFSPLAVQIFAIPTILGAAFLMRAVVLLVTDDEQHREMIGWLAFACTLFYYPLSYWALLGMETGLLTLLILATVLFALRWLKTNQMSDGLAMAITAGLAYLTRDDALIPVAMIFAFVALETWIKKKDKQRFLQIVYAGMILALFPVGHTIFRVVYYGALLPNTYLLKLGNFSLHIRAIGGTRFVIPFLEQSAPVLLLAIAALVLSFNRTRAFFLSFLLAALGYQIYVGGDPWPLWRILSPAMPLVFVLAILGVLGLLQQWAWLAKHRASIASLTIVLTLAALVSTDLPFLSEDLLIYQTSASTASRVNTNTAIAINALTAPGASIGVVWAGTVPYYADRYAVDFLGKSDRYIASLKPDISGAASWGGMISVPGHNKYDLNYSIVERRPTYIQDYAWGDQTVFKWAVQNYVQVEYHGLLGEKTIFLQKDSPLVCWEACKANYRIVPWPKITW
ncbi:MAG TPA: hypothetical protein VLX61_05605 [Anaerolineales bacterium]|nr:hypothetical protein [Anaerolineales bacterium]